MVRFTEPVRLPHCRAEYFQGVLGAIEQRRVRTASGSDRIVRATQPEPLFRKFLFDPVATARGSDTTRPRLARRIESASAA